MGRNPLLLELIDKDIYKAFMDLLRAGLPIVDACDYTGIGETNYQNWVRIGRNEEREPYFTFFKDVTRARKEARVVAISQIRKKIDEGDMQVAQWFLERTDPDNWGRRSKQTLEVSMNAPLLNKVVSRIEQLGLDPTTVFERMLHQLESQLLPEEVDGD